MLHLFCALEEEKKNPHKKSGVTFIEPASLSVRQTTLQLFPTTTLLSDPQRSVNEKILKKKDALLSSFSPSASSSVSIPCLHFAHTEEKRQQRGFGIPAIPPTLTPLHPDVGHMSRGIQASHSHRPSLPHRQPLHTWKEGSCLCALCLFFILFLPLFSSPPPSHDAGG